jgi:hypothetical protein
VAASAQTTATFDNNAPSQASAAGFTHLVFQDSFTQLNLNDLTSGYFDASNPWARGYWFSGQRQSTFVVNPSNGGLSLTNNPNDPLVPNSKFTVIVSHSLSQHTNSGLTFQFGYFEARMRFRAGDGTQASLGNHFGAFYLWSQEYTERHDGYPGNEEYCELDIIEMTGTHYRGDFTQHDWTVINGVIGGTSNSATALKDTTPIDPLDGQWHTFGALWQNGSTTWYVDNVQYNTLTNYSICNTNHMMLTLQTGTHETSGTVHAETTDVQWVKVWQ